MIKLPINDKRLFDSLLEVECENAIIDLHNEYDCVAFKFDAMESRFELRFRISNFGHSKGGKLKDIKLVFSDAKIGRISNDTLGLDYPFCLDNFHRGRFEFGDVLLDTNKENQKCFYLQFVEGLNLEIWAKSICLELSNEHDLHR